jgi:hypothetical protein
MKKATTSLSAFTNEIFGQKRVESDEGLPGELGSRE